MKKIRVIVITAVLNGIIIYSLFAIFGYDAVSNYTISLLQDNFYRKEDIGKWQEILHYQKVRLTHFYRQCKELQLNVSYNYYINNKIVKKGTLLALMVDEKHKLTLKLHPKAGCTSWKVILYNNTDMDYQGGFVHGGNVRRLYNISTLQYHYTQSDIDRVLQTYFNVIHVRHPLKRLESCYTDKIYKNEALTKRAMKLNRERNAPDVVSHDTDFGSFGWFLDRVFHKDVTQDVHWMSYSRYLPCSIPYSYISKLETADQDMEYIIQNKLSKKGGPTQQNAHLSTKIDKVLQNRMFMPYFSTLTNPEEFLNRLMESDYGIDMKLFGYSYKILNEKVYATCTYSNEDTGTCY